MDIAERDRLENVIHSLLAKLGDREIAILRNITVRLYDGQMLYGPLAKGKKDWRREAAEEAFDATVYLACLLEDMSDE